MASCKSCKVSKQAPLEGGKVGVSEGICVTVGAKVGASVVGAGVVGRRVGWGPSVGAGVAMLPRDEEDEDELDDATTPTAMAMTATKTIQRIPPTHNMVFLRLSSEGGGVVVGGVNVEEGCDTETPVVATAAVVDDCGCCGGVVMDVGFEVGPEDEVER